MIAGYNFFFVEKNQRKETSQKRCKKTYRSANAAYEHMQFQHNEQIYFRKA
jgi:hypothetical protein